MRDLIKFIPAAVGGIAGKVGAGKGLLGAGVGMVAARIAKRSVPGALLVGGAMIAKYLYDKKQAETKSPDGAMPKAPPARSGPTPRARRASKR